MDLHAIANRLPTTLRAPRLSYFGILCGTCGCGTPATWPARKTRSSPPR